MDEEIKKVFVPLIFGIIAGILSFFITLGHRERDAFGIIILVFLIYAHKFLMPKIGVELKPKDWVSLSFITFSAWYISWTVLLNY